MNQHSATNYLKPARWVSEWLYDKLTLVNSVRLHLQAESCNSGIHQEMLSR
jgi:hypothetical protein